MCLAAFSPLAPHLVDGQAACEGALVIPLFVAGLALVKLFVAGRGRARPAYV